MPTSYQPRSLLITAVGGVLRF